MLIKMTARTKPLSFTYISLSTVNWKLELVNSVDLIRASELFLLEGTDLIFEQIYKIKCLFRYKTGVAGKITFLYFDFRGNTPRDGN